MVNSNARARLLESRLAVRENQLELAAEGANLGFWTLEPATGELSATPGCSKLLLVRAATLNSFEAFMGAINPQDQARVRTAFAEALRLRRDFSVEFRLAAADGAERAVRCTGRPHLSSVDRQHAALAGMLLPVSDEMAAPAQRVGAALRRLESLRDLDRTTLASRMNSEIANSLSSLKRQIQVLTSKMDKDNALQNDLGALATGTDSILDALRVAIFEICPPGVAELGLLGAIERYATERAAAAGIGLSLYLPEAAPQLDAAALESLYSVACAGIDNVLQHARANRMSVSLNADDSEVVLCIADNGVGISNGDLAKENAVSLFAASERLAEVNGELRVRGTQGQGTMLEATIVLKRRARPLRQGLSPVRVA